MDSVATSDHVAARFVGSRPELDDIARAVMRARVASALFGRRAPVRVGRYDLVRPIGIGGGGAVYAARDPELDREVAIKLITAATPALRARALAEGQALARLAHPNVVPVFDVGESDERVYLVMELVRGVSLRAHAHRARSLREIIRACRQAGEGLAAAHEAGLVHRDFKLDNAVIADERVRVIDFGLAIATEPDDDAVAHVEGTPAYMAPEQRRGDPIVAASDQYAFGVSLREAAAVRGSLPRWLDEIVDRATADDPAARFPSMSELLRALANDQRARWRRRVVTAVPAVLVAVGCVGFAIGRTNDDGVASCDARQALGPQWSERAAAVERHLVNLATPFAIEEATRTRAIVDRYATRLTAIYDAGCERSRIGALTPTLLDRRIACLAQARTRLDASLDLLAGADAVTLPSASRALAELPDLDRCEDAAALVATVEPPSPVQAAAVAQLAAELDVARVGVEAATPDGVDRMARIAARARALGYRPLLADALLAEGRAAMTVDRWDRALAPLGEAATLGTAAGVDAIAIEAFARAMWIRSVTGGEPAAALAGFDMVASLAERLGPRDRFAHALLFNNAGVVELAAGHTERARERLSTALALAKQVSGPGEVELAFVRANLAMVTDDDRERGRLHAEATAILRARLGDDHPMTLDAKNQVAFAVRDPAAALAGLRGSCRRYVALHPTYAASIAECGSELAWLELAYGSRDAAREAFGDVVRTAGDPATADHVALARAYVLLLDGDPAGATRAFEAIATHVKPTAASHWWELLVAANVELGLATAATDATARHAARDRAVDYLSRGLAIQSSPSLARRLAWATSGTRPSHFDH